MVQQPTLRSGFISKAVVTAFVIAATAIFLYFSHVSSALTDIGDLTAKRTSIWLDITRISERLVKFDETTQMPQRIILRVQQQLAKLLQTDSDLRARFHESIDNLDSFPFGYFYAAELAHVRTSDVPPTARDFIARLASSPPELVGARYSSLTVPDALLITSHKVLLPLQLQDEALRNLRSEIAQKRTPVEWTVTTVLLIAIWTTWFTLLRPSLVRSLELQQKITMSEQRARTTLSSIGDAVIVIDAQGLVQMLNPAAEVLVETPERGAIGNQLTKVLNSCCNGHDVIPDFPVDDVLNSRRVMKRRIQLPPNDIATDARQIDLTAAPIIHPGGGISGVVLVLRDITLDLKIREQLRNSEKERALSALAGGLAHEFNNALAIINGASDLMELKISGSPEADKSTRRNIDSIKNAVKHSSALTAQLLAIGRRSGFKLAPIDISTPVTDVIEILRRTTDRSIEITLDVKIEENQRYTLGDYPSLQSTFLNFGLNSINAIDPPGKILVTIERENIDAQQALALGLEEGPKEYIKVRWRDSGRGIPQEIIGRIFEPFYTTRTEQGGIGLGLSVAQSIILEHKGSVSVSSKPAEGAAFTVYLPCTNQRPKPTTGIEPNTASNAGILVLFAEDEGRTAELIAEYLTSHGFEVLSASNGREALELYRNHRSEIDVVVLDINLPLMPGHEVARAIRKLDPQCSIIMSTGYLEKGVSDALEKDGITTVLKKPYPAEDLISQIARLRRKPG
ncbi:MAG: response regulator [Hyphomicrobiaceae bacterium]